MRASQLSALLLSALLLPGTAAAQRSAPPDAGMLADVVEDPRTLVRLAERMLAARRSAEATDLLERAEARLLTRAELATEADRPAVGGAVGDLAAARDAIARGDQPGAATLIASALRRIEQGQAPMVTLPGAPEATGSAAMTGPADGGGAGAGALKAPPPPLPAAKPPPLR